MRRILGTGLRGYGQPFFKPVRWKSVQCTIRSLYNGGLFQKSNAPEEDASRNPVGVSALVHLCYKRDSGAPGVAQN